MNTLFYMKVTVTYYRLFLVKKNLTRFENLNINWGIRTCI